MTLTVKDVTITYRRRVAVSAVSWDVGPGFHALLGPNGAGKSSLLRAIATLQPLNSGVVELDGLSGSDLRRHLGYCPQENLRKSHFTVAEHLLYMCWLQRLDDAAARPEVDRILQLIDLQDRPHDRISGLSGGMRRRVAIGSALVGNPGLMILDEPSAGLDMAQREGLSQILARVSRDAVVIVSTHLVEDVLDHADTLTVMDRGSFVFSGPLDDFAPVRQLDSVRFRYLELVAP